MEKNSHYINNRENYSIHIPAKQICSLSVNIMGPMNMHTEALFVELAPPKHPAIKSRVSVLGYSDCKNIAQFNFVCKKQSYRTTEINTKVQYLNFDHLTLYSTVLD